MILLATSNVVHDPGGKVRIKLPDWVRGGAGFSECGRYRPILWREWGPNGHHIDVSVIGMNASTATADVDDPTMIRVRGFVSRLGFTGFEMLNLSDYRATFPEDLKDAYPIMSDENIPSIIEACRDKAIVIAAWGVVPKALRLSEMLVTDALSAAGISLLCLGYNRDGSPKHPLYLSRYAALAPWPKPPPHFN